LLQVFLLGRLFTPEARQLPLDPVQLYLQEAGLLFQNGLLIRRRNIRLLLAESHSATGSASATPHALSEASLRTGAHPSSSSGTRPVTERSGSIHERHFFLLSNLTIAAPVPRPAVARLLSLRPVGIIQFRQLATPEAIHGIKCSPRITPVDLDPASREDG
jgi:hypothetical protein